MKGKVQSRKSKVESKRGVPEPRTPKSETRALLLEIGCEEIPARFLADAQRALGERLVEALFNQRLLAGARGNLVRYRLAIGQAVIHTYSTPRRLVAYMPAVLRCQAEMREEIHGPSVKVAVDSSGEYTRAAESFAQRYGASVNGLIRVATAKGERVALKKTTKGLPAVEVLGGALPEVILGIPFPKSMYWTAKSGPRFIRPIRWILALLGEGKAAEVVPFEIAGVRSGDSTYGHRALGRKPIRVRCFEEYAEKLRAMRVEIDPAKRRQTVQQGLKASLEGLSLPAGQEALRAVADPWLEDWVVNSTEWPHAIAGEFDRKFLGLPREILITVMRDHQKYFAVEDSGGNLAPRFVAFLNREGDPKGLIRQGHERVLRARFTDAQFFWNADQKIPLRDRLPLLEKVTYHEKLGSYADKVRRMESIAQEICAALKGQGKFSDEDTRNALRAVQLCKCDLTTQMVQEFPELQGVVGGLYARAQGEPAEVADAVYDHYLPQGADDKCPRTIVGGVVSLADKLDAVVTGFAAGLQPTGSSDPFGLRRAGNGAVRIAAETLPGMDLQKFLADPMDPKTCEFLRERVEYYLAAQGAFRYDTIRAVSRDSFRSWNVPSDAARRAAALEKVRDSVDFVALAVAAKRTRNILEKSATLDDFGGLKGVDPAMICDGAERDLYEAYRRTRQHVGSLDANSDYEAEFRALAALRPVVDQFFDKVLVMDKDPRVRANRLTLLNELRAWVFSRFADLSQIESTASTSVGAPTSKGNEE